MESCGLSWKTLPGRAILINLESCGLLVKGFAWEGKPNQLGIQPGLCTREGVAVVVVVWGVGVREGWW